MEAGDHAGFVEIVGDALSTAKPLAQGVGGVAGARSHHVVCWQQGVALALVHLYDGSNCDLGLVEQRRCLGEREYELHERSLPA